MGCGSSLQSIVNCMQGSPIQSVVQMSKTEYAMKFPRRDNWRYPTETHLRPLTPVTNMV